MVNTPSTRAIYDMMRVATTAEAAQYCYARLTEQLAAAKMLDKQGPLLEAMEKYARYVEFKSSNTGKIWDGDASSVKMTDYEKWQNELAKISSSEIVNKNIKFDYAVSDAAQFIRGYTENSQPVDKAVAAAMDVLFNAWLAKHKLISKDGVVYQSTPGGEIDKDKAGNPIKANVEKLKEALKDPKDGFEAFCKKNNNTLQVSPVEHPYTTPKVAEPKRDDAPEAPAAPVAPN